MTDRIVVYHESAHVVIASQFGFSVRRVMVHAPGSRPGEAGRCEVSSWRSDVNRDPIRCLVYVLSGSAAEKRLTGHTSPRDGGDRELAAMLAAAICEHDEGHPRVRALLHQAETIACALMQDPIVWCAVEAVAKALTTKGTLSGRDVQQLLRKARR